MIGGPSTARLSAESSLGVFKTMLGALARPGRVFHLPAISAAPPPPAIVPALALADDDSRVAVIDDSPVWGEVVRSVTGASVSTLRCIDHCGEHATPVDLRRDDMVVALCGISADIVRAMAPEVRSSLASGARLFISCRSLADPTGGDGRDTDPSGHRRPAAHDEAAPESLLQMRGPGAAAGRSIRATGISHEVLEAIDHINRGSTGGVDTWLVSDRSAVVGLPRSCSVTADRVARPG